MHIEHLAVWVKDIEYVRSFFRKFFQAQSSEKYVNPSKKFTSYFLSFSEGSRLELMHRTDILNQSEENTLGLTHIAFSLGSKEKVDQLTLELEKEGHKVIGNPRTTGDGYYESVIQGPEEMIIELTI
ncbi:MAG: VOC family protein [Bacteroidota bacterium]